MRKPATLAAAFAMLSSCTQQPAFADACVTITQSFRYGMFTITQRSDAVNKKLCLSFHTDDENIEKVLVKVSDEATSTAPTISEEGCLTLRGSPTQELTPMVIQKNGEVVNLMTLRLPQAIRVYNATVGACVVHPSSYQSINFVGHAIPRPL